MIQIQKTTDGWKAKHYYDGWKESEPCPSLGAALYKCAEWFFSDMRDRFKHR